MDSVAIRGNDFMNGYPYNMPLQSSLRGKNYNTSYHNVGEMNYYGYPFGPADGRNSFEQITSPYSHKLGYGDWGPIQAYYSAKTGIYYNPTNPTYVYPMQTYGKCVYDQDVPKDVVQADIARFFR